ncbi:MAG: hypothetical protein LBL71_01625 [Endomicrobium sp.]|jgi:hypothetical protein|nr:hypothetical protein [Endomicrobium sp.]
MKFLRNILAFTAVPAVLAAGYTLIKNFLFLSVSSSSRYIPFWIGVFSYIVFQIVLYKPIKTYIFGHELSHAVAGFLSGAIIKKFKIGKNSGSVVITKSSIWIALAPYFFPIYTIVIIIVYVSLGWFIDIKQLYEYYIFLVGFSVSFYIALTIYILSVEQPDLEAYGTFFSYIVILALNIVVFTLLIGFVFENAAGVKNIFVQISYNIVAVYKLIYNGAAKIWLAFQKTR